MDLQILYSCLEHIQTPKMDFNALIAGHYLGRTRRLRTVVLTNKQILIINEQLKEENVYEFIEMFILSYVSDTNKTSNLLSLIPKIANKQLQINTQRISEQSNAINLLMSYRISSRHQIDFATLLHVAKAYFPQGNDNGGSIANKMFFKEFINAIKTKTEFNYESVADWSWICNIVNCRDWMISVIIQNVDVNFIEPQI